MLISIVSKEFASRLINVYYPKTINNLNDIDDMDRSVLCEMGNITSGACANSIATLSGMVVDIVPPEAIPCSISQLLKIPVDAFSKGGEKVVVIDEEFKVERSELSSHLFLILDSASLNKVFQAIGLPPI